AIERLHRWAVPISLIGLALPIMTAIFGSVDETGARLAIKIGSLPAIQTSEPLKLVLIVFMAWFIDRQGRAAKGRDHVLFGWLHIPALRYFIPGVLFFLLAVLALTLMSDYGAVLILGGIFLSMLYAGFETRTFTSIILLGAMIVAILSVAFSFVWDVPTVVQYRFQAFQDPWSSAMIVVDGQPSGVTIAQGPGYQIQQAIYAVIAGGLSGSGLGFGSPDYVPLAHSDFILAAIVEEMGAAIGVAVLFLFAILLLRILRVSLRLPPEQTFERMLAVGIGAHLFTQVVLMAGGTLNLLPMTGVTIPFLSLGGMALLTNLAEIGLVFALIFRQEKAGRHD
ncbi:MAG TPA: FtsW/RodA/SpoVE family cell cycle protein, partial [Anaerolineaceae bacterium]|nr:FtsW/RodA/SpoVE family cell cycle protein [Anaerolineaceae bacterium]